MSSSTALVGAAFSRPRRVLLPWLGFCLVVSLPAGVALAQSVNGLISRHSSR